MSHPMARESDIPNWFVSSSPWRRVWYRSKSWGDCLKDVDAKMSIQIVVSSRNLMDDLPWGPVRSRKPARQSIPNFLSSALGLYLDEAIGRRPPDLSSNPQSPR